MFRISFKYYQIALDRLVSKYAPHNAPSLLKMNNKFYDRKLKSAEKNPEE